MAPVRTAALLLLSTIASFVSAQQQGVLVNGNSKLPSCASSCPLIQQAVSACPGASSGATQQTWSCFCQSAFLVNLKNTASGASVCASSCTNAGDAQQVVTWYNSNCGSDYGASEHADGASGSSTGAGGQASSASASGTAGTATNTASGSSSDSNDNSNFSAGTQQNSGDWWSNHYKWIIMLIVLVICLPLLAFLAVWLKRRHDRKQDLVGGGFNAGITHRSAPMSDPNLNPSGVAGSAAIDGSGRNSPARARDAFMPYGYGYNRSESRLGSKQAVYDDRPSPLARGDTPLDPEKDIGVATDTPGKKKSRRVLVRERSADDSIETEKR